MTGFFHNEPSDTVAEALACGEECQSMTPVPKPWPLAEWPRVPSKFVLRRDDSFFPAAFQRWVLRERLGIVPEEMDGEDPWAASQLARPALSVHGAD